jgi:hypothetical protein
MRTDAAIKRTIETMVREEFRQEVGRPGCDYLALANGLFLIGSAADGVRRMKIAFNCDDMRCDYGFDWEMPRLSDGSVWDTDVELDECQSPESYADFFMGELKEMRTAAKEGRLQIAGK